MLDGRDFSVYSSRKVFIILSCDEYGGRTKEYKNKYET